MSGAAAFIWILVVILALAWALMQTGTIRGVNLDLWINILLVLAVLGAVFNLFVMPFLGRSRTTRTSASAAGTTAPVATAAPVADGGPGRHGRRASGHGGAGQRCDRAGGCPGNPRPHVYVVLGLAEPSRRVDHPGLPAAAWFGVNRASPAC